MSQSQRVTEHGVSFDGNMYSWDVIHRILETLDEHVNPDERKHRDRVFDGECSFLDAKTLLEVVQGDIKDGESS